ncbi:metal ABC transporter solute-binding protein, Zn/Mn family [Humitalea sp. 24SJ18S-53]|uniref:metal ABC transporter solute-binding protein, Zn/Mn family n=1 Tax=Humitalea sp. 24SJ18S-53 TaxID=3422307 RepID=UPI003D66D1F8
MNRRSLLLAPLLAAPAIARTAQGQAAAPVVASFSILGDLLRQTGGEAVAVRAIAGPDADAHVFQPRPSDAGSLRGAKMLLRNGLGFDPWFDRLARGAAPTVPMVTAAEGLPRRMMPGHAHGGAAPREVADPHAWQDVTAAAHYVRNIAAGLAAAGITASGAEPYLARLAALDAWVRAEIARVPAARRVVVTSHDAFGWFAAAYGVRFLAPQGVSTDAQASAAQVARLIRQLRQDNITAVFIENMSQPATLQRLATEAGVRVQGRLFADALSPPDGPAPSYEAMMRHNVGLMVPAMLG